VKTPIPNLDLIALRQTAIAARLNEVAAVQLHRHDDAKHQALVADARARAAIGDAIALEAALKARDESAALAARDVPLLAAIEAERAELLTERTALEVLEGEEIAARHRRRRQAARDRYQALAEKVDQAASVIRAHLPDLVAASEIGFDGHDVHHAIRHLPDWPALSAVGIDGDRVFRIMSAPLFSSSDIDQALTTMKTTIEGIA
jgi:hypothetical protein